MAQFPKLNDRLAGRIGTLFPAQLSTFDLTEKFQRWAKEDIELAPEQIGRTLDAIRRYAIPRARALVARQRLPELVRDANGMLADWEALETLLQSALRA